MKLNFIRKNATQWEKLRTTSFINAKKSISKKKNIFFAKLQ